MIRLRRLVLVGTFALPAMLTEAAQRIEGVAVRRGDAVLVYREEHRLDGRFHRIDYRAPDGTPIGENRLDYRCSDSAPDFNQLDLRAAERQAGYWEDGRYVLESGPIATSGTRRGALDTTDAAPLVASSGFDRFLRANWERLLGGASLVFRFAMPARLHGIELRARHERNDTDGLVWFVIEPGQVLLRAFVEPIRVGYDAARRLAVYRGLSNLRDADGSTLEVEIRYTHTVPDAEEGAETEPLAAAMPIPGRSHCAVENT